MTGSVRTFQVLLINRNIDAARAAGYNSGERRQAMVDKKKPADPPVKEMVLKPAGSVAVSKTVKPRPDAADHKIHVRRMLPIVPDRAPTKSDTEDSKKS